MASTLRNDRIEIIKLSNSITIKDSLTAPILRSLEAKYGKDDLATVIAYQIMQTAAFFNLGNNIREDQALETAYLILEKYPAETLQDFTLVFKNAKTGRYGELYNRLDGQTIFKWIEAYLEQKAEYREQLHQQQKVQGFQQDQEARLLIETKMEGKPVLDALKEGIGYESMKKDEEMYHEYKIKYLKSKLKAENQNNL
jgi:hypothetical protein